MSDKLQLRAVPLDDLVFLDGNPKTHGLEKLATAIRRYGFVDPPKIDAALDGQLVYGNGRVQALHKMRDAGEDPPRGIDLDEAGDWLVPVQVGVDAATAEEARALAIDHNTASVGVLDSDQRALIFDPEALESMRENAADLIFDLAALEDGGAKVTEKDLKPVDLHAPKMVWVLVGVPLADWGGVSPAVEDLAKKEGVFL